MLETLSTELGIGREEYRVPMTLTIDLRGVISALSTDRTMSHSSFAETLRVWELPGWYNDEFYVAAYSMHKAQRQ